MSTDNNAAKTAQAGSGQEQHADAAKAQKTKFLKLGDKGYSWYLLKRCAFYFKPYTFRIVISLLAMGIAALAQGGTAYLVKPAMDDIFLEKNREALFIIPLAFLIVTLVKVGGRVVQNYMMQYSSLKVLETLRDELFKKIVRLPLRFYEGTQVGMLMSRIINDVMSIRESFPAIVMIVRQVITMIALMGVVIYQDPKLALISFVVLPLAFFPFIYFGRRLRRLGRKGQSILADASVLLQEILSGIRVIKAFATESPESDRFDKENRRLLRISLKRTMSKEFSSSTMELVGAVGIGLVLFYGGLRVIDGTSTPGTFFSFVTGLALLYDPIKKLNIAYNDIQTALASAERVFDIIDSEEIQEEQGGKIELESRLDALVFDGVTFCYSEGVPTLKNINLTVNPGERLAIVGPSGAGKTTFVNLIPRFYDPSSGVITLNGRDLREYTLSSLRRQISVVSQDNFLFNYSIRQNIAYGQGDFTDEQIVDAARAAYAHEFIMAMPDGYDTVVGERGAKLSGGQKQRLTIARAIAKNSPLLILDEATSALDSESEKIVQKALENLMRGRTSIVIAHRLSTVLGADRILVMDQGQLAAQGPHAELLESCPLYARLYAMQFGERGE